MIRSILSVPGHKVEMVAKARTRGADLIAWDLEDSVPEASKASARSLVSQNATREDAVRINALSTPWGPADLRALIDRVGQVNLPKVESAADVLAVRELAPDIRVLAVIESPRGALRAAEICAVADAVAFGRADFCASAGLLDDGGGLVIHAMGQIAMAAHAAGIPAYDSPCESLSGDVLEEEVQRAYGFGFAGKICVHPSQVAKVRGGFGVPQEVLDRADELAEMRGGGVQRYGPLWVAEPHYRLAEKIRRAS